MIEIGTSLLNLYSQEFWPSGSTLTLGDDETPTQYEVWIYDEKGDIVTVWFDRQMLEFEWVSPIEYVPAKPEDIKTLAEIIVNVLLEDPKVVEESRRHFKEGKY